MKIFRLPDKINAILFDIDLTLYRHQEYYHSQIENQILYLANEWDMDPSQLKKQVEDFRSEFRSQNEGRNPSFGNTLLLGFGVPISRSVELRNLCIHPEEYLEADPTLQKALSSLATNHSLYALTNNTSTVGWKTLKILGVEEFFLDLCGLDQTGHSKPHPEPFQKALEMIGIPAEQILTVGDRYEVDLEVPLKLGFGAILAENMMDIYGLEEIFAQKS